MGSKTGIVNHINAIRCYLRKGQIKDPTGNSYGTTKPESPEISETFISSSTGMEFILIPPGEFHMGSSFQGEDGSDCESAVHKAMVKDYFYMGISPVTQKQWKKIMGTNPSKFKDESRPVEMVSWEDIQEFIKRLNEVENTTRYRLPSEVEWEYACRAGTKTRYFFGDDESSLGEYAWYVKNAGRKTHPVGQKKPNYWGLYDMHGNVWELVLDKWNENYTDSVPCGSSSGDINNSAHISRGGSWYCDADYCHSDARFSREPQKRLPNLGFRLVREL